MKQLVFGRYSENLGQYLADKFWFQISDGIWEHSINSMEFGVNHNITDFIDLDDES